MRTITLSSLVACLAGMIIILPAEAFTLTLKPDVNAAGSYITLNEVAEISNIETPRLLSEMQQLRVALAPKAGHSIRLTRRHITRSLRYKNPVLANQIDWNGADAVVVSAPDQSVELASIRQAAEGKLHTYLENKVSGLDIHAIEPISTQILPHGPLAITAKSVKPDTPAHRMSVEVEITAGNHYRRIIPVWFAVKGSIDALVAKANISSGSLLDESMFNTKHIELAMSSRPVTAGISQSYPLRTRRSLEGGSILTHADIERAPPVTRQQQVAIHLITDGIMLETTGIALSDAEIGMPIQVKNPRSGEVFGALVSAPGIATITVK